MSVAVFNIAKCPDHGLHGERSDCFECGKFVEQVQMVELAAFEEMHKRFRDQRRQLASLNRKLAAIENPIDEPQISDEEIALRQATYLQKIDEADQSGDIRWLVDQLVASDREKQILVAKVQRYRSDLRTLKVVKAERTGAHKALGEVRKKLDEKERERVRASQGLLRLEVVALTAVHFLEARRKDGLDFPYDSRPLRKLKEAVAP